MQEKSAKCDDKRQKKMKKAETTQHRDGEKVVADGSFNICHVNLYLDATACVSLDAAAIIFPASILWRLCCSALTAHFKAVKIYFIAIS